MVMQLAESCAASSEAGHAASSESQPFARSRAAIIWQKKEEKEKRRTLRVTAEASRPCSQLVGRLYTGCHPQQSSFQPAVQPTKRPAVEKRVQNDLDEASFSEPARCRLSLSDQL